MAGKHGFYSDIIIYDERRRYYYLYPQKNKPFLDDEIRDMGIGLLDQVRRAVQSTYGDVAAPNNQYAGFYSTAESFKVKEATDSSKNFLVTGGNSLDHPAVLYAKGFYIFLVGDVEYKYQMYPSDAIDLNTETDKTKTLTPIPSLTTPSVDRIDIVYVSLHFEEVSSASGTDSDVYRDTGLKNPVVGTDTANRLRAVFDIKVHEGWTGDVNKDIFMHSDFLGGIPTDSSDPTENEYKIPIAAIYREAFDNTIAQADIVDLLELYSKRVLSVEELSYRTKHGGYVQADVDEKSLSGFDAQFPGAIVDEGAFATGLNRGLDTEAFNTNSVTPRVLDNSGKYYMDGLMVGHSTGIISYETGPEQLHPGEAVFEEVSARSVYIGYGVTGITGMREYTDSLNVVIQGETGRTAASIRDINGETGSAVLLAGAVHSGQMENFFFVDYKGRVGLNTLTPGWDSLPAEWGVEKYNDGLFGVTGVNVIEDVNGSVRVRKHMFVDGDGYMHHDMFGRTWKIPEAISNATPAYFGFTGLPDGSYTGIADSISAIVFKRGIAVMGETGVLAYGETGYGVAGQYECFDSEGQRMFTIGDLGHDFDRVVKALYGVSMRKTYLSNTSFLHLRNDAGSIIYSPVDLQPLDVVHYDIVMEGGDHVTGMVTIVNSGMAGLEDVKTDILANPGFPNGYTRTFTYRFYTLAGDPDFDATDEHGNYRLMDGSGPTRLQGVSEGVQIIIDTFGDAASLTDSNGQYMHGRLIFKDMPEDPINVTLDSVSMRVVRSSSPDLDVTFVRGGFYGASEFGGALANIKFAKLDLGEGADAWLFNGDVYFNGTGLMNRVTFSPNAVFRNDVFIYGSLFADQMNFNFASVSSLHARNNIIADNLGYFIKGVAAGNGAFEAFDGKLATYANMKAYVKGSILAEGLDLESASTDVSELGSVTFRNVRSPMGLYAEIGGIVGSADKPFGLHLYDSRSGITNDEDRFTEFVIDASDGFGSDRLASLRIVGDLYANSYFQAEYMGIGPLTTKNTDYQLVVQGPALVNDTLTVKALRFVGDVSPEGTTDIITPNNNVTVVGANMVGMDENNETFLNNEVILREKKFTSYDKIALSNGGKLGAEGGTETGLEYYDNYITPNDPVKARWARDNVSYTEEQMQVIETAAGTSNGTVVVQNIPDGAAGYRRYSCQRVTLCSLGEIVMEWKGFVNDPDPPSRDLEVTKYEFSSNYFRGNGGSPIINWLSGAGRYGDENRLVHVEGSIINADTGIPTIYTIDKTLSIYIPLTSWWSAKVNSGALLVNYKTFVVYYPYENVISNSNIVSFANQTEGYTISGWKLALYPRLIQQDSVESGTDKVYTGTWSLDLIVVPESSGLIANMAGRLYINYDQR